MISFPQALDTPWKIWNELWRWLAYPAARVLFQINGIPWGRGWKIYGLPNLQKHRRSSIRIGPGLRLRSALRSNPLCPQHPVMLCTWQAGAEILIGANFGMTGGTICATELVVIGDRVTIGANTTIVDADFHPIDLTYRVMQPNSGQTAPVQIEDDVFIGMSCLVLKGVTIGHGSVVGAGSVVTKTIPPFAVAAGNPARVIRKTGETG